MRMSLVVELVRAHKDGDNKRFADIVSQIALDEERKGNGTIASQLRESNSMKVKQSSTSIPINPMFAASSVAVQKHPLKDRDSSLELIDWIEPSCQFSDLSLAADVMEALEQILVEDQHSNRLKLLRLQPTRRLLLFGPPGCGKTSVAFALAYELNRPLAYVRLDALISSFLGQTGNNIRRVFDAVKGTNAILFLDEFDAIGKKRDDNFELGELKRVVTTLLQNFDFLPRDQLLIAATNHEHLLDEAIWRRFDAWIRIDFPNKKQREQILRNKLQDYPIGRINWSLLVEMTEGLNCAIIENTLARVLKRALVNDGKPKIETDDIIAGFITNTMVSKQIAHGELGDHALEYARELREKGISLRAISKALGVAKSTLSDNLKED